MLFANFGRLSTRKKNHQTATKAERFTGACLTDKASIAQLWQIVKKNFCWYQFIPANSTFPACTLHLASVLPGFPMGHIAFRVRDSQQGLSRLSVSVDGEDVCTSFRHTERLLRGCCCGLFGMVVYYHNLPKLSTLWDKVLSKDLRVCLESVWVWVRTGQLDGLLPLLGA